MSRVTPSCGIVLAGASCTGKSRMLDEISESDLKVTTLEMERLRIKKAQAGLPNELAWLNATLPAPEFRAWVDKGALHSQGARVGLLRLVVDGKPFICTCGGLSGPDDPFYGLLMKELGVRIFHVLVDPPLLIHLLWILKRGRIHRSMEFLSKQRRNSELEWDASIRTADQLRECAEAWLIPSSR